MRSSFHQKLFDTPSLHVDDRYFFQPSRQVHFDTHLPFSSANFSSLRRRLYFRWEICHCFAHGLLLLLSVPLSSTFDTRTLLLLPCYTESLVDLKWDAGIQCILIIASAPTRATILAFKTMS
ncbi:hypothetical protein K505DRAFT_110454 [Melanomma pulvis-pyrius CBS 109.77]|uniref:Uncharacterized protein n=1 Tax=Melanomma pulvis-pyrius CBS 109.77 TaxID=1314802 RepID=A0A6A6WWN7_9PLEO|nr:hypothetical protein K505DRAFT_110454 [Melanomma pulvis-pyrius CBS 109.77]